MLVRSEPVILSCTSSSTGVVSPSSLSTSSPSTAPSPASSGLVTSSPSFCVSMLSVSVSGSKTSKSPPPQTGQYKVLASISTGVLPCPRTTSCFSQPAHTRTGLPFFPVDASTVSGTRSPSSGRSVQQLGQCSSKDDTTRWLLQATQVFLKNGPVLVELISKYLLNCSFLLSKQIDSK